MQDTDGEYEYDSTDDTIRLQTQKSANGQNDTGSGPYVPLTEQEKARRDEIAKQREERLRQRLLRRENNLLNGEAFHSDDNSQSALSNASSQHQNANSDFNIRNYFLMHKGLKRALTF